MFGFNLWARFGVFRDPMTITQNMTFSIPPKTTIGGMLAAILGMDYQDYFNDPDFFNFGYSLILQRPVRKKSFVQNYIEDYTKKSALRLDAMLKVRDQIQVLALLDNQNNALKSNESMNEKDLKKIISIEKKIEGTRSKLEKTMDDLKEKSGARYPKSKPIFRELLIDPSFLIFIHGFKYENEIVALMKNHESVYPLYMGNSEFAASYRFVKCSSWAANSMTQLDSFTGSSDKIAFESGKKYTSVYAATQTTGNRAYRNFRHVVVCDKKITLSSPVDGFGVKTEAGEYACEFI
ncbi:MAG: CRISPR-associated protein Cas5 [Proteobacteria bacterium]|nr:CRISPR-associated protein Cas5 [Pseudomonadota bacterium]